MTRTATANTMPITIWRDDGDTEETINVPARFEIWACEGCCTDRGASVECDGGGFTSSEWAEQDDDFREGYLAGRFDQPCTTCSTSPGRIRVPDLTALSAEDRALYEASLADDRDYERMCRMERAAGA